MREAMIVEVAAADHAGLEPVVADWTSPQRHAWRAKIIPLPVEDLGTAEIMCRTAKIKSCAWRW